MKQMHDDANNPVTKGEFREAMAGVDKRFIDMKEWAIRVFATKVDLDDAVKRLEEKMYTKEDHAKFMEYFDAAMEELSDVRIERKLNERQMTRMDDTLVDHEKRIRVLEKRT